MTQIMVVSGFKPNKEGESNYSTRVFERMASNQSDKISIHVIAHRLSDDKSESSEHVTKNLIVTRLTNSHSSIFFRTIDCVKIATRIYRLRPDLVHFQGVNTKLYGGMIGEPIIISLILCRLLRIPTVMTVHSTWTKRYLKELWKSKGLSVVAGELLTSYVSIVYRLFSLVSSRTNILVSGINPPIYSEFISDHKLDPSKLMQESHPCDYIGIDSYRTLRPTPIRNDNIKILISGFVRKDKGLHLAMEAFNSIASDFPDVHLLIVGSASSSDDISYSRSLIALRKTLTHGDQIFLDFRYCSDEEFDLLFYQSQIIVAPYTRAIGASGPVHKAISFGKCVIASDVDQNKGLKDVILLYTTKEDLSECLAKSITEVKSNDLLINTKAIAYSKANNWDNLSSFYISEYLELLRSDVRNIS
jgi:glycosyltransferase involved in cell wall biosynthesis